ncbi:unnamed protein product [Toxocara canis]|uniref:Oxidored_molyb domain-containing protein n=1 Tax=Toxocara canis TaxID=6265 RepID=A0A183UDC4_TOXCA|nr:unnamed protein product [Toxocara canis]
MRYNRRHLLMKLLWDFGNGAKRTIVKLVSNPTRQPWIGQGSAPFKQTFNNNNSLPDAVDMPLLVKGEAIGEGKEE